MPIRSVHPWLVLLAACSVYDATAPTPAATLTVAGGGGASGSGGATQAGAAGDELDREGGSADGAAPSTGSADASGAGGNASASTSASGGNAGASGAGAGGSGIGGSGPSPTDAAVYDAVADAKSDADGSRVQPQTCAGYALQLDGVDDYALVPRMVQDDFTLEAWIKTSTSLPGAWWWEGDALLYADAIDDSNDFGASILNDKISFGVGNPNTVITGTTIVTTGRWVHFATTRRKATGEIQLYVNGVLEASQIVATQTNSLTSQPLLTFGATTLDKHYFRGQVDEIRVFNIVRTEAALRATMHERLAGNEPGLVGYWRFDDGSGNVASDSSPSGASFVLANGPTWVPSDAPVCPDGF